MPILKIQKKTLPCHPCPHRAACCFKGTSLSEMEAEKIRTNFGDDFVEKLDAKELRERFQINFQYEKFGINEQWVTAIKGSHCIFWDEGCKIYHSESYPQSCRLYPWQGAKDSKFMSGDAYMCPELKLPKPPFRGE